MKLLFSVTVLFCVLSAGFAQGVKTIRVNPLNISYAPKNFHLASVVDDRPDKAAIGTVNDNGKKQPAALEKGLAACFEGIIANNIKQDKSTQLIILHINKLNFDIARAGNVWKIEATASFSFYVGNDKLLDFNGKGQGETGDDLGDYIQTFIKQTFENDLTKFDTWWEKNKGSVVTSNTVKVNVAIGKTTEEPNAIVYSLTRPLQIADFQGPPDKKNGPEMAATSSGLGFEYFTESENGQLVVNVTITPYFDKSVSWFKEEGKNARLLHHEQLHFDIAAIKACELAAAIRNTSFTTDNYKTLLDSIQKQNRQKSTEEEDAYDEETKHGLIFDKQMEWEKTIKAKVKQVGCY